MSLVESIKSAFQGKKKSALEDYQKALAQGKPVEQVVRLAVAAGLSEAAISEDAGIVDKAGALGEVASGHTALAKTLDDAAAKYAAIESQYAAAVARFTEQLNAAGEEVEAARAGETPARKALEQLTELYRAHAAILPAPPAPVRALLDAQDREAAIAASREVVRRARSRAGALERQLATALNESRSPGVTNFAQFSPAKLAGVVGTLQQPVLQDDRKEFDGKQGEAATLEAQLSEAVATAERMSNEHATKFNERV